MFVLTETVKTLQNSDSTGIGLFLCIVAAVCIVLLVWGIVDGGR